MYMVTLLVLMTLMGSPASAQFFNNRAAIQGYLKQGGVALNDVSGYPMRFIVKRNSTAMWCQTLGANVPVVAGIFNTVLSGNSNCQSLTNALSGSVFAHTANSDTFVFDVVVDVNKDGFGGADDATFAGIDVVSTPLAIYANYANTAATATSATTATTAGNVSGIVAIANGGTGAATAAAARTALGLGSLSTVSTSGNAAQFLKGDGTWGTAGGSGTVSSVIAGTGLTGGTITSTGTIAVDVGTTANKILSLDAAAKIPAVDGSLLTNVNAAQLQGRAVNSVAPTAGQVLAWNNTSSKWEATTPTSGVSSVTAGSGLLGGTITSSGTIDVDSTATGASSKILALDGSGIANIFGAALKGTTSGAVTLQSAGTTANYSLTFPAVQGTSGQFLTNDGAGNLSWSNTGGVPDSSYAVKGSVRFNTDAATSGINIASGIASVNSGTGANQLVKLDAASKLPAVDGSALTALSAANISSGTLSMARGGTGAAITAANGGMIYSTASALAILAPGTAGQVLTSGGAGAPTWTTPLQSGGTNTWSALNTFSSGISSPSVTGASTLTLASTGANDITLTPGTSGSVVLSTGSLKLPASGAVTSSSGALTYTATTNATLQSASGSTTTVGNSGGASVLTLQSGTGGLTASSGGNVSIAAGSSSGTITIGNASTGATLLGNTGAASTTTLQSVNVNVGGASTTAVDIGGTGTTTLDVGNAATGTLTTTVGSTASASATTIQAGTGKVKVGSAGVGFTAMGVCSVASTSLSTTATNVTCTGVPALTTVAVHCSPGAALNTGTSAYHARATGTLNQIALRATANINANTYTCMFMY